MRLLLEQRATSTESSVQLPRMVARRNRKNMSIATAAAAAAATTNGVAVIFCDDMLMLKMLYHLARDHPVLYSTIVLF